MSTEIDDKIVSMRFDNKHFENNVQTSINSLDKLKKGLNLSDSAKGLTAVNHAAQRVSFNGIANGVDGIRLKFSALQVAAVTALAGITSSALNAGKNIIKAFTVDPVVTGLTEYETKLNAITTILTNTKSKGTTLGDVNKALDELNLYADKTIYNFAEMTRNVGTFTAAGVDLETSVGAIKGIANLAAGSGSSSQQASTAMYQLSQALAEGRMSLQSWNSVVNAGMGGELFQFALVDEAVAMGKLSKASAEAIKSGIMPFREAIKATATDGALLNITKDMMINVFNDFAKDKSLVEAATQVKTFTMLMDTLKESAQSGWAQSWETIIGNKDEAAKLWTSVNNTFDEIIGASARARNKLLDDWKNLGGRDLAIKAVSNAFKGLLTVIAPIKSAFNDIFPAMTGKRLMAITKNIEAFTSRLKLGDEQSKNLKSTFSGIFAVVDILGQALSAVAKVVGPLLAMVLDGLLKILAPIGKWLVKLDNLIKKTDIFNKVIQNVTSFILSGMERIKKAFKTISDAAKKFADILEKKFNFPGFKLIHALLERTQARMSSVGEAAGDMRSAVSIAFEAMGNALVKCKFFTALEALWKLVKTVFNGLAKLGSELASGLVEKLSNVEFTNILDLINSLSLGGLALAITAFLKGVEKPLNSLDTLTGSLKGMINGVTGILNSVRGCFEAYQTQLKAQVLIKIALAIAILTASIVAISLIDSDKLANSLAAVGVLFGELLVSLKVMEKIGGISGSTLKACGAMIAMSIAVAILAGAMKKLSSLDWEGVAKGLVSITGLSVILVSSAKILSNNSGQLITGATSLIAFALAIKILAGACVELSVLDWDSLEKGLAGVGVLLVEVSIFLNLAKFSGKAMSTATGILILSAAIKVLASACNDFGSMQWDMISKGLSSVGVLLTEIAIFTKLTGNAKNVISTGIAITIIAASMKILASAVSDFGAIQWDAIGRGLTAMGVAMLEVAVAMRLMPKDLALQAAGLVIVASALVILAKALGTMGGMSFEEIDRGLVTLGGSLAILAIGLNVMNGTLAGSAALIIAAGAIAVLTPALSLLGAMSWSSITKGLVSLAGAFTILGVAGLLLGPLVPSILGLSASMALIGVSVLAVGAGLMAAGIGLQALAIGFGALATMGAAGAVAVVAAMTTITIGMAGIMPAISTAIAKGIISFVKTIGDGSVVICEAVTKILLALIVVIKQSIPAIVDCVVVIIDKLLKTIAKYMPSIIQSGMDILLGIYKGIAKNIKELVKAGILIIVNFLEGVASGLPKVIQAAFDVILAFINGLADAVRNNKEKIISAIDNLFSAIIEAAVAALKGGLSKVTKVGGSIITSLVKGIKGVQSKVVQAGKNVISGFTKGIKNSMGSVVNAAKSIGTNTIKSAKSVLGIHSPSRVFKEIGKNTIKGQELGMISMIGSLKKTTEYVLVQSLLDPAKEIVDRAVSTAEFGKGAIRAVLDTFSGKTKPTATTIDTMRHATSVVEKYGQQLYKESEQYKTDTKTVKEHQKTLKDLQTQREKIQASLKKEQAENDKLQKDTSKKDKQKAAESKKKVKDLKDNLKEVDKSIKESKKQLVQDQKDIAKHTTETFNNLKKSIQDSVSSTIDPLNVSIDSQIDLFTKFGSDTEVTIQEILDNMKSQVDGVTQWNKDLDTISKMGIAKGLLDKLRDMGPSGANYVKAFTTMTAAEIANANKQFIKSSNITAQTLLDNFSSSLDSAKKWGENMSTLAKRGLRQDVLESLGDAGLASSDYVDAFMSMSSEQLAEFNGQYKQYLKLPASVANEVLASYAYAGTDAAKKFSEGLSKLSKKDTTENKGVTSIAQSVISAFSKVANKLSTKAGSTVATNVSTGMEKTKTTAVSTATNVGKAVFNAISTNLSLSKGKTIGENICGGLVRGLSSGKSSVISAAIEVAAEAYFAAKRRLDINSPSKAFEELGKYSVMGLTQGLTKYSDDASSASTSLGTAVVSNLKDSISKIVDFVSNDIDYAPTIRPVLDLSNVEAGTKRLGGMFSRTQAISVSASMTQTASSTSDGTAQTATGSTFQFTQNNYSPKALSRLDIYRQTKNQFSSLKGVLGV